MTRLLLSLVVLAAVPLAACGPAEFRGDPDAGERCAGETARCVGESYQTCVGEQFVEQQRCAAPLHCAPSFGCSECDPQRPQICQGDDTYTCSDDGTIGNYVGTCPFETCQDGFCQNDECAEEAKLIYVVDDAYRLLSFDPRNNANTFTLIGQLNCPAGPSWPDWPGLGPATPFSMSVDRSGRAWVVYTSGEIFWVSTADASCQGSPWVKGSNGFQLFGMGFVSDSPGSAAEHLYISGGAAAAPGSGNLGSIDPQTQTVQTLGGLAQAENSPELSGTGNAELYAYYPGMFDTFVARLDKTTAQIQQRYTLPPLDGQVMAWAFAHWGGRFYIFVTDGDDFLGTQNSQVVLLDPMTGAANRILSDLPYFIVGAGVSTCAPVVIE